MADDFDTEFERRYNAWKGGPQKAQVRKPYWGDYLTPPQEVLGSIARNVVPLGALGTTGAALDLAMPEEAAPLSLLQMTGRAGAMGLANTALNKYLPKSLGGDPDASTIGSVLGGALPELGVLGGGRLATKMLEKRLANRSAGAMESALGKLDPEALAVQERVLAPRGKEPFPAGATGPQLTEQTFSAQQPINQTIQAARTKYGAPIGEAYKALKDPTLTVSDQAARDLADSAAAINESLIAPAPKAQAALNKVKRFMPKEVPELENITEEELNNLTPDQRRWFLAQNIGKPSVAEPAQKLTLDDLRELRQQVNTALRTAKGGDVHALGALQDRLDEELLPHLPSNMSDLRRTYAGFIKRWGYKDQAALNNLKSPQEVSDWLFKDPTRARDLFAESNPVQQEKLREQFIQHVYGPLNSTDSQKSQYEQVLKRLKPYMKDRETAKAIMGPQAGQWMHDMASWPAAVDDFKTRWAKDPKFRDQIQRGMRDLIVNKGVHPDEVAQAFTQQLISNNPQLQGIVPQLPAPLAKKQAHSMRSWAIGRHGAMLGMALGSAAMGGKLGYGAGFQAASILGFLGMDAGMSFTAASKLGLVAPTLKAIGAKNGYLAGRALGRTILNAGARSMTNDSEPVEIQ